VTSPQMRDVVVVGAGPAGLNAALMLGRARRKVLLADTGTPRNAPVRAMHGFLSRDGTDPAELRSIARKQLQQYGSVEVRDVAVDNVRRDGDHFEVTVSDGSIFPAHRVILATGVVDELPDIDGLAEHWGRGVFNCPYCDGWEQRDQPLAVLGADTLNVLLALNLVRWSGDVVLCTNGDSVDADSLQLLSARGVTVRTDPVVAVEGNGTGLERIVLADGALERRALFFHAPTHQRSDLAAQLGCAFLDDGSVQVDDLGHTSVPGVFAVGDISRRPSMPVPGALVIIGAAEGAVAAVAIDQEFLFETLAS
jgi:thioredoxin reductase